MHILTLTAPLPVGGSIGTLTPGEWIMSDQNAFELALLADRDTARLENKGCVAFGKINLDTPGKPNILLMRSGAIGDLLFLTPVIEEYRKTKPGYPLHLCCRKEHFPLFENSGLFDALVSYPLEAKMVEDYWFVQSLENVIELAHDTHATDAFASALGVNVADYKPVYVVTDEEKSLAKNWITSNRPRVGIQLAASVKNRNYPLDLWAKVIFGLDDRGWEVFLFGHPGQIPEFAPNMKRTYVHNMTTEKLTFRESAALLSQCNAFVGVDSSLLHLCHALDVPAVGLFGAFSWQTRTAKAPLTHAITGEGECKNCRWHAKNGLHFPPMPCRQTQVCSVLASITPERIIAKVNAMKP
jgi:ADP-heptose:LPS heptosyltransferase